jgi:hypothetical protein
VQQFKGQYGRINSRPRDGDGAFENEVSTPYAHGLDHTPRYFGPEQHPPPSPSGPASASRAAKPSSPRKVPSSRPASSVKSSASISSVSSVSATTSPSNDAEDPYRLLWADDEEDRAPTPPPTPPPRRRDGPYYVVIRGADSGVYHSAYVFTFAVALIIDLYPGLFYRSEALRGAGTTGLMSTWPTKNAAYSEYFYYRTTGKHH